MSTEERKKRLKYPPCKISTIISGFWKVKNGEGKAEIKLRGGLGSPDTLASWRGKKWKMRRRREYKEI